MKNNSEDKAERILMIYSKLKQGKIIYREEMSAVYGVSSRTIQRDIADIQCFLQNQLMETGSIQEIIYDKSVGGYRLQAKQTNGLSGKAVLAVCKILLESRALAKAEMLPIIYGLIALYGDDKEMVSIKDMLCNEIYHYVELRHGQELLDLLWDLQKAVKARKYIEVRYKNLQNNEVIQKIKPAGVMFSGFYFYLAAYRTEIDGEKSCEQDYTFPIFYRVDRIQECILKEESFRTPYEGQFEEEEFRKRIQFMEEGKLRKVEFQYVGKSLESVLDRLPTAIIKRKDKEGYVIEAEVFGPGLEGWLLRQGKSVENIQVYEKYS